MKRQSMDWKHTDSPETKLLEAAVSEEVYGVIVRAGILDLIINTEVSFRITTTSTSIKKIDMFFIAIFFLDDSLT